MAGTRRFIGWVVHLADGSHHTRPFRLIAAPPVGTMVDWYVTLDISHGDCLAVFDVPDQADAATWRSEADAAALQHTIRLLGGLKVNLQVGGEWEDIRKPDW
jgi:hypothetical protein